MIQFIFLVCYLVSNLKHGWWVVPGCALITAANMVLQAHNAEGDGLCACRVQLQAMLCF